MQQPATGMGEGSSQPKKEDEEFMGWVELYIWGCYEALTGEAVGGE